MAKSYMPRPARAVQPFPGRRLDRHEEPLADALTRPSIGSWPMPRTLTPACGSLLLLGLAACGGEYPLPPETEQIPFTETLHGVEFEDPYRWLEDQDSPETRAFIDRQNEYAELIVGEPPEREWARRRLAELIDTPSIGSPNKAREYELFTLRRTGEELASIVRRPAPEEAEAGPAKIDPAGEYEVVIDPTEAGGEYAHIGIVAVSPDGGQMLYNVRIGGEDETTVRLRDLERNVDLDFELPRALNDQAFFAKDGSGIYYTVRGSPRGFTRPLPPVRDGPGGRRPRVRRGDWAARIRPRRAARRGEAVRRSPARMGQERRVPGGGRHLAGDADRRRHGGPLQHPPPRRPALRAHEPGRAAQPADGGRPRPARGREVARGRAGSRGRPAGRVGHRRQAVPDLPAPRREPDTRLRTRRHAGRRGRGARPPQRHHPGGRRGQGAAVARPPTCSRRSRTCSISRRASARSSGNRKRLSTAPATS